MHGIKRARQTPEAANARRQKERAKLEEYLALVDDVLLRKKATDWSNEALDLTTKLLTMNPEFYTVWNYRRNILTSGVFPRLGEEKAIEVLANDLAMTMSFLKKYPKVYWIWNHRRWCLENVPEGPGNSQGWRKTYWAKELFVVEKMLEADARNFHAWDYRRYVVASMPERRPDIDELAYTTHKIESSFSNFSAWHQRSKVYPLLWNSGVLDASKSKDEEFEFVKQALYVDPNDQSAWIYHRWLIGSGNDLPVLQREIAVIEELLAIEPDSKWCLESLLQYKSLLLRKGSSIAAEHDRQKWKVDCLDKLKKLKAIDPLRLHRYEELENEYL